MNKTIKLLLFSIILFICQVLTAEENKTLEEILPDLAPVEQNINTLLEHIKYLEEHGEYENSRVILAKETRDKFSHQLVQYWLQSDQKILDSIKVENTKISIFEPEKRSWKEYFQLGKEILDKGAICQDPAPISWYNGKTASELSSSELKEERLKRDENKNFGLLSQEKISQTLKTFDELKMSISELQTIINQTIQKSIKQTNQNELSKLTEYSKQIKNMKAIIKEKRTQFLSYDVVSPYLAVTNQSLYLYKEKSSWFQKDKEAFKKAIKNLSFACHQQRLMECTEDVRLQFLEVQKKLKSMVGKEEFEELKIPTTLQDSSDSSKKRGADAWWD